jgi:Ca2+-binding EF-hand superfamily protein
VFLFLLSGVLCFAAYACGGGGGETPQAVFESIDVNDDGSVVKEEICAFYKDATVCEEKYTQYDENGDGYIVLEEFVASYE